MTDSEILDFCKQHDVELSVRFDPDSSGYHLHMRRDWLQIDHFFSSTYGDHAIKSVLNELEKKLTRAENARKAELEEHNDPD